MAQHEVGSSLNMRRLTVVTAALMALALVLGALGGPRQARPVRAATFNYGEALQKSILFYEAQQSGRLPSWNRVSWRGDATVNDGKAAGVDLSGGWYDAGDHVKFGFPMAFTTSLLGWGVVENRDAYAQSGQLTHMLNNLRFANDYFIKAHPAANVLYGHVGDVTADHNYWGPPEMIDLLGLPRPAYKIDASCPGTDLAAETAAAMAISSMVFKPSDPTYAATLLSHARQLFTFADTTKGTNGTDTAYVNCITAAKDFYNSTGEGGWGNPAATKVYWDELVWAAIWLYQATGETSFLDYARTMYPKMGAQTDPGTTNLVPVYAFGFGWNDKEYAVYALMAKLTGEQKYRDDTQRYLDYWTVGYKGQKGKITPGGLAFIFYWASLRMSANTAFVAMTYADYLASVGGDPALIARYHDFGKRQVDYALGANPRNGSYMIGFGTGYAVKEHHRGAHGAWQGYMAEEPVNNRHTLIGALVGGPDEADAWVDSRTDYVRNEVAVDFNAGITAALGRLYREYGGAPLASFPTRETPGEEIFAEASVNSNGTNGTGIALHFNNKSAWPARAMDKATARYFFTLDGATTPAQIAVTTSNADACPASGPTLWSGSIYYVTINCTGKLIHPGNSQTYRRSTGFTITSSGTWDAANDWSFQGLAGAGWQGIKTDRIVIYNGAAKEWGLEPGGCTSGCTPPTSTSTTAPTATRTNTSGPTATRTSTTPPSATRTSTSGPTATRTSTGGPTATRTATRTNTSGATATRTNTSGVTATRTSTGVPATPTPTGSAPPSPTRTATSVPPPTPTATSGPASGLKVQYKAAETMATSNQIKPHLNIVNGGTTTIALSELKARYYYTKEGTAAEQYFCDYAVKGCGNITGSFAAGYLEVGFTSGAGSLAAGQSSGEIQSRFAKTDWSNYTQTGDYSFDPTKTAFADWSRVTLYRTGTLIWGTPAP